jgi:hypothetical protein
MLWAEAATLCPSSSRREAWARLVSIRSSTAPSTAAIRRCSAYSGTVRRTFARRCPRRCIRRGPPRPTSWPPRSAGQQMTSLDQLLDQVVTAPAGGQRSTILPSAGLHLDEVVPDMVGDRHGHILLHRATVIPPIVATRVTQRKLGRVNQRPGRHRRRRRPGRPANITLRLAVARLRIKVNLIEQLIDPRPVDGVRSGPRRTETGAARSGRSLFPVRFPPESAIV